MHKPMQFGGCPAVSCSVQAGVHVSWQAETHETSAVAVQLLSHCVVSRAAQTISPATGSHLAVHVSVGNTSQLAAAAVSR
jgi:hypothetical protein